MVIEFRGRSNKVAVLRRRDVDVSSKTLSLRRLQQYTTPAPAHGALFSSKFPCEDDVLRAGRGGRYKVMKIENDGDERQRAKLAEINM